jgi:hypothetical protein
MATVSIFSIRLGRLLLTCERDMTVGYVLISQNFRTAMSLDAASALGGAVSRIQWRAMKAVDGRMKPGQIFAIQLSETKIGIGVSDDGFDLYVETDAEHVRLSEGELQALMFSLGRLRDDVNAIHAVAEQPHHLDMAPGLRSGFGLPRWADDTKW